VKTPSEHKENDVIDEFKRACVANDAAGARRALSGWLRDFGPSGTAGSLLAFAAHCGSADLHRGIRQLDALGFRPDQVESWDGKGLWKAFTAWHKQRATGRAGRNADVTDLYA
jgi:hypothetical protein